MPAPAEVARRFDRDYADPTIRDFYRDYDFVAVFFVTVTADGADQLATVTYPDGETGTMRYGSVQPLQGETWLAVGTMGGDSWLEIMTDAAENFFDIDEDIVDGPALIE